MMTLCYVGRKLMSALILASITMQLPLIFTFFVTLLLLLLLVDDDKVFCTLTHTYILICNIYNSYVVLIWDSHKYCLVIKN